MARAESIFRLGVRAWRGHVLFPQPPRHDDAARPRRRHRMRSCPGAGVPSAGAKGGKGDGAEGGAARCVCVLADVDVQATTSHNDNGCQTVSRSKK
eukprot:gene16590-biopygen17269